MTVVERFQSTIVCIIYCVDTNEINEMMTAIDTMNDFYCMEYNMNYITCNCNEKMRKNVMESFATLNAIQLLFSVRIMDECIDIPSCDSIYITYPSQSKIRTIQRMNRATRIDKQNPFKVANIFIWCQEYDQILITLSGLKEYDTFFRDKVNIVESNYFQNSAKNSFLCDSKILKEKYLIGIKEFRQCTFDERLNEVIIFIQIKNKLPSKRSKDKNEKILGAWISTQKQNYTKNINSMKDETVREKWKAFTNQYQELFLSNGEIWDIKLDKLHQFIQINHKTPSNSSKDKNEKILGKWISHQKQNYKKNSNSMKDETIREKWKAFTNQYQELFTTFFSEAYSFLSSSIRISQWSKKKIIYVSVS